MEGIENSFGIEFDGHKAVIIVGNDIYTVGVIGTGTGICGLFIFKPNPDQELVALTYENLPTTSVSEDTMIVSQQIIDYTLYLDNNGDGVVDETRMPDTTQQIIPFAISLITGWNFISIPIQLSNSNLDAVLQSINGHYRSVWSYDSVNSEWQRYVMDGPDYPYHLETIKTGEGYWIEMSSSATLTLEGWEVGNTPISLEPGWNMIGYSCLSAQPIEEALFSITGNYDSVWTYDAENGKWERCLVDGPEFLNNLDTMEPGKGYCIHVTAYCLWTLP